MSITIDLTVAEQMMSRAVALADDPASPSQTKVAEWIGRVNSFSEHCERVKYRSSVAVLGNALLAKSANSSVDVFSLKAGADDPGAYDARRTAEKVLVPAAQRYKFHLGVTGPQPLNNAPYFRFHRIDKSMIVRRNGKPLLEDLINLLHLVRGMTSIDAVQALAGFIIVRRSYAPKYAAAPATLRFSTIKELASTIDGFVRGSSDRGARAMACSAALMDATFGDARVRLGKVHEPDRKVPGDIALRYPTVEEGQAEFERVLEVRDKPVERHTVHPSVLKASRAKIWKTTVVAVSSDQTYFDIAASVADAKAVGVDLTVFVQWDEFAGSLFEWAASPEQEWVEKVAKQVLTRLKELQQPTYSSDEWSQLISKPVA